MNVNNYTDWNLVKYSIVLSFLIFFNYFLWSINSWEVIRFINGKPLKGEVPQIEYDIQKQSL